MNYFKSFILRNKWNKLRRRAFERNYALAHNIRVHMRFSEKHHQPVAHIYLGNAVAYRVCDNPTAAGEVSYNDIDALLHHLRTINRHNRELNTIRL